MENFNFRIKTVPPYLQVHSLSLLECFSSAVFPNAPSSQAAPVLLVADALLTLLTVQVEKSTTMPSIGINFPLVAILHCAHTIFQTVPHFNIDFQSYMQQVGNKSQL